MFSNRTFVKWYKNVFGLDGDALGVKAAQVGVLEDADQVRFRRFLQGAQSRHLNFHTRILKNSLYERA
jgi:hypothetical protein